MHRHIFDSDWEYSEETGLLAMMNAQWTPVDIPHDAMIGKPRSPDNPSGTHGGYFPGTVASYRKTFFAPKEWQGGSVQLEIEGAYMNAEVSVNRHLIDLRPYGYSSFVVDITPYLVYGKDNQVGIVTNNTAQPNSRWYSGTGLYRHVWLRIGGSTYIPPWGVFVTTPVADEVTSVVQIVTELTSVARSVRGAVLRTTVLDADGTSVAHAISDVQSSPVQQTLLVEGARLWSVDEPNLYTLLSEVFVDGTVTDTERTPFGIRSISFDPDNGFRLNGVPMNLRGGCVHHDHGPLGAASYDRAEERKVELLKSAGFNALRTAHNPPAPALLDACDRLGMVVIDETFDCWRMGKTPNDYHLYFEDWWMRDTAALVKRDRNHPSVVMWSIGNEILEGLGVSEGSVWAGRQADYVRTLDPTRPVTSALMGDFLELAEAFGEGGDLSEVLAEAPPPEDPEKDRWGKMTASFASHLDIVGYNYIVQRYEMDGAWFPGRMIVGTETFPHRAYTYWTETERLSHVLGDFVWTAFDYLGEAGIGFVRVDGPAGFFATYPHHFANCGDFDICGFKRPQSFYRDLLWGVRIEPFIGVLPPEISGKPLGINPWGWEPVIDSWTFPGDEGKPVRVDVYAVDDEVELFVNGESAGRHPAGAAVQNKATFEVTYEPGTIEAVCYTGGTETSRTSLKTAGDPAALRLTVDRATLRAAFGDLAYVAVEVVDEEGAVVKHAEHEVHFEVAGAGELIAVGTANPVSEESYTGSSRRAYEGRLLAVIRTTGEPGEIALSARAAGLAEAEVGLEVQEEVTTAN